MSKNSALKHDVSLMDFDKFAFIEQLSGERTVILTQWDANASASVLFATKLYERPKGRQRQLSAS